MTDKEKNTITKSALTDLISDAVGAKVAEVQAESIGVITDLKTKIEKLEAQKEATVQEEKELNMPIYDAYKQAKIEDFATLNISFEPKKHSDQWFLDATPAQRFQAMLKGIADKNESMIVKSWGLSPIFIKQDGTPYKTPTKQERLQCMKMVSKDLNEGTATAGGVLVPPDYRQTLINCLFKDNSGLLGKHTTWVTDTGAATYAPTLTSGSTVHWIGESGTKVESDPVFGQLTWTPKKQIVRTDVTEELLDDSNPAVAQIIQDEHVRAMILDLLYCFFYGDGATQPRGINLDIPAANTIFVGAVFNGDDMKRLKCAVRQDYREGAWFYAHDCVWCIVERFKDTTGNYLWKMGFNDMLTELTPEAMIGYPYYRGVDDTMPISFAETGTGTGAFGHIFYGNPANYIWVVRNQFRVKFNDKFDWATNIDSFITESRIDGRMACDTFSKLEGVRCTLTGV